MNEEVEGNESLGQEVEPGPAEELPGAQETVAAEIPAEAPASESAVAQEPEEVSQPAETITEPEPVVKVMVPIKQLIPGSIFEYGGSLYELVAFGILVKNLDTGAVGNIDAGMSVEIKL